MTSRIPLQAAALTPAGRGAVAVVGVAGQGSAAAIDVCFASASGRKMTEAEPGRIYFGRWQAGRGGEGSLAPEHGEEVIVCRRDADEFEIHCHGGIAAVAAVLEALRVQGCAVVDWEHRNDGRTENTIAVEARSALAKARTTRTAGVLLDQLAGALHSEVATIAEFIAAGDRSAANLRMQELIERGSLGLRLTSPFRLVVAGRPNVGKSSLLNALVGYERAIVFDQPGTTRDVVTASAVFDGWPVELADTAGLRDTPDELEAAGIEAAHRRRAVADLTLLVFDAAEPWTADDDALLAENRGAIVVHNKIDRLPGRQLASGDGSRPRGLAISARDRLGLAELITAIVAHLVPQAPPPGAAVPFTERQVAFLREASSQLDKGDTTAAVATLRSI